MLKLPRVERFLALAFTALVFAAGLFVGQAKAQPYGPGSQYPGPPSQNAMEEALGYLDLAADSLQNAPRDEGGHRTNAAQLVQQAAQEVRQGIAFANSRGSR